MKKKLMTAVEGILFMMMILSVGAMDSPQMLFPIIGVFVSMSGLLVMAVLEEQL